MLWFYGSLSNLNMTRRCSLCLLLGLKIKASLKAQEFALDKGSEIEVTGYETVDDGFGKFPEAILNFKLINQIYLRSL